MNAEPTQAEAPEIQVEILGQRVSARDIIALADHSCRTCHGRG